jgi:hypothetical protein
MIQQGQHKEVEFAKKLQEAISGALLKVLPALKTFNWT